MRCRLLVALSALLFCSVLASAAVADETTDAGDHALEGRVLDPEGNPVAGATVRVVTNLRKAGKPAGETKLGVKRKAPQSVEPVVVETGDDGSFSLSGLGRAPYIVRVEAAGLAVWSEEEHTPDGPLEVQLDPGETLQGILRAASGGDGVAGATLWACDRQKGIFGRESCREAESDAEGAFRLSGLPAERIDLVVLAEGYEGMQRGFEPEELSADEPVELLLGPGGDLELTIVDAQGGPIDDAWIDIRGKDFNRRVRLQGAPSETYVDMPRSDADGRSSVRGLTRGIPYTLYVQKDGYARFDVAIPPFGEGETSRDQRVVLTRGAIVSFRLVDADGVAIDEPEVFLSPSREDSEPVARLDWRETVNVRNDRIEAQDDGSWLVVGLPAGRFDVWLSSTRYLSTIRKGVALTPGEVRDLGEVTLRAGLEVHGSVTVSDGEPVGEGGRVRVRWMEQGRRMQREAAILEDGSFHAWGVEPDTTLEVEVESDSCGDYEREDITAEDLPLEIVLERAAQVRGRVVDQDDNPVAGAVVRLSLNGSPQAMIGFSQHNGATDEEGAFKLSKLEAGGYTLEVRSPLHAPLRRPEIELAAGQDLDTGTLTLEPGLEVRGIVLSKRDRLPVGGATVTFGRQAMFGVAFGQDESGTQADADGRFVYRGLGPGPTVITARHPDFAPARETLRLREDSGVTEVELMLEQGGRIVGTVTDADGNPVVGVSVGAMAGMAQSILGPAETDETGRYVLDKVTAGTYTVVLSPPESRGMPRMKQAVVVEGEDVVVDFSEDDGIRISGVVTEGDEPLREGALIVMPANSAGMDPSSFRFARIDEAGRYELQVPRAGSYRVMIQRLGDDAMNMGAGIALEVPEGVDSMVRDIELDEGGSIEGVVRDAEGNPVSGAQLAVYPAGDTSVMSVRGTAVSDDSGLYRMAGLEGGEYRISANHEDYVAQTRYGVRVSGSVATPGVDFTLEQGRKARIVVRGSAGVPVPGAIVTVAAAGSSDDGRGDGMTDAQGVAMVHLPAGEPVDIFVMARGWAPGSLESVTADGSEVPELQITLTEGATLQVVLTDASGAPAAGLPVRLEGEGLPQGVSVFMQFLGGAGATSAEGVAEFANLLPGRYRIYVGDDSRPIGTAEVSEGVPNQFVGTLN